MWRDENRKHIHGMNLRYHLDVIRLTWYSFGMLLFHRICDNGWVVPSTSLSAQHHS
jgi:hypothetical protein